ncbi:MAG: outer membrane lipoprotein carrier protein LolA [Burkholderiaceae bacterium]|nr:outer membrane lipoprotein carrier protein LolA [Burkholderiaceae bacterium]
MNLLYKRGVNTIFQLMLVHAAVLFFMSISPAYASDLIADVRARVSNTQILRGQFEQQKTVAGFKKPLVSNGEFLLSKSRGIIWRTNKPFSSTLIIGNHKLTGRQSDGSETFQFDTEREPALRLINELMLALVAGDLATLQRHFKVEGELIGRNEWTLRLTSTDANLASIFKIVAIEGDRYVRSVRMAEVSGDNTLIRFEKLSEAPSLSADEEKILAR